MTVVVVGLNSAYGSIQNNTEELLRIQGLDCLLEHFAPNIMLSYYKDDTVACRADQLKIGQRQNWRCVDENCFERLTALPKKFLPARTDE